MRFNLEKVVKIATISIVVYLLCFGIAEAFFPIRPFWNDEWRLIYNIKFKTESQLWGRLDLLQQCPRVLLITFKKVMAAFDYSYTALRTPALVLTFFNVLFCFYLKSKLLPGKQVLSNLLILIFISSQTFTDYMVQVKHYEMDIFLTLLALWQLITLLDICAEVRVSIPKYLLLCFSFLAAPYFSYIYPIAIAPVFAVVFFRTLLAMKTGKLKWLPSIFLPLLLAVASIVVFYMADVQQLMADTEMYSSYKSMLGQEKVANNSLTDFWNLFALVGSGVLFEIIFGALGIIAFLYGAYRLLKAKAADYSREDNVRLYSVTLIVFTLILIFSGKVMGGVARLVVFTVPSISLLIVSLLADVKARFGYIKVSNTITAILFLGLFGNILSTCINTFTYPEYANRIKTFQRSQQALEFARSHRVPLLFTDGIRGDVITDTAGAPGYIDSNTITPAQIAGMPLLCSEAVLKVNPGYKVWDPIPVYWVPGIKWSNAYVQQLPAQYRAAVATNGVQYWLVKR